MGTLNTATTTSDTGQPFEVFDINVQTIRVGTNRASGGGGNTGVSGGSDERGTTNIQQGFTQLDDNDADRV